MEDKKDKISFNELLNEYDVRYASEPGIVNANPQDDNFNASEPTIIAAANKIQPNGVGQSDKPYRDELIANKQANILPYQLDGSLDVLADIYVNQINVGNMLKAARSHPSLTQAQRDVVDELRKRVKDMTNTVKHIANDLEKIMITSK